MIDEDVSDKDEDGVDEPDIVARAGDNEYEDDIERQDTPPEERDNASTLHEIEDLFSAALSENNGVEYYNK